MNPPIAQPTLDALPHPENSRLGYLDATRAFALVLGIVFHACLSFTPAFLGWAVQDVSTSPLVALFMTISHSFRMATFFLLAGFLSRLTFHRQSAGDFVRSRLLRIGVPFILGWFILHPLVVSGWIMGAASLHGRVDVLGALWGGVMSLATLPKGLFAGSHLWFLYYLALTTALTLAGRGLLRKTGSWHSLMIRRADDLVAWLGKCPFSAAVLAMPTAVALWFMRFWGMDTPDQSLVPQLPALFVYSSFFFLGWMLNRQDDLISEITRFTLPSAFLAGLGIATVLLLGDIERDPAHAHYLAAHVAYALGYALSMWSLALLTIGAFRKLCPRPNAFIRYIADSSYWMYLFHLPVVVWLQVAVAELPWHWSFKLALISGVTIGLSLVTYDLFVRSTFIGRLLNGRRRERVIAPWLFRSIGLRWPDGIGIRAFAKR